ncbi:MAG TPA: metal-dependent hydrolase [Aldersonia sp.]
MEQSVGNPREPVVLQARDVSFDWAHTHRYYMDDDPVATHLMNILHLFLPEGEEWFCRVFKEALPMIHDPELRRDVLGFIGQEAMHARSHTGVHDYLHAQKLDIQPFIDHAEYGFRVAVDKRCSDSLNSLVERLAIIAAIEHLTAYLGDWVLTESALDRGDIDPTMLDLLRWHGAEEVEHRSVAFDVLQYFDARRSRRIRAYLLALPVITLMWWRGVSHLLRHDPQAALNRMRVRDFRAVTRKGLFPSFTGILRGSWQYFGRDFHPSQTCSTELAVAYLAASPAARAASK